MTQIKCLYLKKRSYIRNDRGGNANFQFQPCKLAGASQSIHVCVDIQHHRRDSAFMVCHSKKGSGLLASQYFLDFSGRGWDTTSRELSSLSRDKEKHLYGCFPRLR